MAITDKNARKKKLFFVLADVLIPGPANPKLSRAKVKKLLSFLKKLQDKGIVELFLVTGFSGEKAKPLIEKSGLEKFFKKENIFFVTKKYIDSKEEIDRQRHLASLGSDQNFVDEFFKQSLLMDFFESGKILADETMLIGHDILVDAFYSARFSKVDFVLVRESLSERNKPMPAEIKGLNYVKLNESDFRKLIQGKFPANDTRFLENYVLNKMKLELFRSTEIEHLVKPSAG